MTLTKLIIKGLPLRFDGSNSGKKMARDTPQNGKVDWCKNVLYTLLSGFWLLLYEGSNPCVSTQCLRKRAESLIQRVFCFDDPHHSRRNSLSRKKSRLMTSANTPKPISRFANVGAAWLTNKNTPISTRAMLVRIVFQGFRLSVVPTGSRVVCSA